MSEFPEYCKIHSVYKRDERGRFILGDWAKPELGYLADAEWRWTEKVDGTNVPNAAFIAAANPQAVLALLDRLAVAEAQRDEAVGLLRKEHSATRVFGNGRSWLVCRLCSTTWPCDAGCWLARLDAEAGPSDG